MKYNLYSKKEKYADMNYFERNIANNTAEDYGK